MSEVSQEFNKDGGISNLSDVLGTGAGANTGSPDTSLTRPPVDPSGGGGIGNTFLTEPLHAEFVKLLEEASFLRQIAKTVTMTQPTLRVPAITSGLQVYYHGEQGQEANETTMSAGDFTLEARKIMAQVLATAELYEDSQQNIEQIITGDFVRAIAQAEEQAFLLGRQTAVGGQPKGRTATITNGVLHGVANGDIRGITGFVTNENGADDTFTYDHWGTQTGEWTVGTQADTQKVVTSPLHICDGVLTVATDENNMVDMKGASFQGQSAYKAIREGIFRLGLLGRDRNDLILILNPVASNQLLQSDELMTLDKYGSNATILTGEVGSLFGVKIIESSFLPSNGISAGGNAYGKGGYGVLVHKPSLLLGDLRKVQVENERIIQNDAYRTVISERLAFGVERRNCAVGIGDIATDVSSISQGSSIFFPSGQTPAITGGTADTIAEATLQAGTGQEIEFTASNLDVSERETSLVVTDLVLTQASGSTWDVKLTTIEDSADIAQEGAALPSATLAKGSMIQLNNGSANDLQATTLTLGLSFSDSGTSLDLGDTAVIKIAIYDGSQYSNIHTYTMTVGA